MIDASLLEIATVALGVTLLLLEAFGENLSRRAIGIAGILGVAAICAATFFVAPNGSITASIANFYVADPLALFFKRFALVTTMVVLVMALDYAPVVSAGVHGARRQAGLGEFFALPIFTCAGLMWMASAVDFVMIFVSLELVTISFYVLVAFTRRHSPALEAGVKYLILSAISTGFLVYGITWIFGVTGETNLGRIASSLAAGVERGPALFGMSLVLIALGFKIAAVPFQIWVPDVYQGAPTPVTALLSVGSKAGGFVVLLRVLQPFFIAPEMHRLLGIVAGLTLIYGNLAALPQTNVKRLLAYSSIAHAGYLLVAVVSLSGTTVLFYLAAYLVMTLLSFAVLVIVGQHGGDDLTSYDGLAKRSPFLAFAMLIAMASLAGVPFTAGFLGKFFVFDAAIRQQHWTLVIIGVITVAAGFYYYFKVIRSIYWEAPTTTAVVPVGRLTKATMSLLILAIVVLGVYPTPILNALR